MLVKQDILALHIAMHHTMRVEVYHATRDVGGNGADPCALKPICRRRYRCRCSTATLRVDLNGGLLTLLRPELELIDAFVNNVTKSAGAELHDEAKVGDNDGNAEEINDIAVRGEANEEL
tara:strand:- start:31 stop:390 length:360 start_codon:yes stop_codon:yes gene_type:complete